MTTPAGENTHDHEACVKLLTETMARLNEIAEGQMQGILDIAIAAADAANSVTPGSMDADAFIEKVKALIDSMRSQADTTEGEMGGGAMPEHVSPAGADKFCEAIERQINMAIENGLSLQQQLNVTGVAVLSEGANLLYERGNG